MSVEIVTISVGEPDVAVEILVYQDSPFAIAPIFGMPLGAPPRKRLRNVSR